jgi:hypothetical protein
VGGLALGGGAIGWLAIGGAALGATAALGGLAVAAEFALGGLAVARHANDAVARDWVEQSGFFAAGRMVLDHAGLFVLLAFLPVLSPVWRRIRRRHRS